MIVRVPVDDNFFKQMDSEFTGWSDPLARLREALEKNEFTLYCQPILALAGPERYPMAEILIRLREEEAALLPPGEFLPLFEQSRMMPQLDRWVLRHVLARIAGGSRIARFTINLSGQTLEDADFPRYVAGELMADGVAAKSVAFEIDESEVLERPQAVAEFARAVQSIGVGLLIDGFGRKSASFAPLKVVKFDFIKVDGAITRKLLTSETAKNKMNAILRVADAIGIGIVAECVEEQDVLVRLKALGVGYAQGFGVYEPRPIDSIAAPA